MNLDDYVSASEASRLLGVSRQRVSAMIREGDLPAVHPWPRAVRISRAALDAYLAGDRPPAVHRTAARHWVLYECDVESMDALTSEQLRVALVAFIGERRPRWAMDERRDWASRMADRLAARS